jgi:hypothetical protein
MRDRNRRESVLVIVLAETREHQHTFGLFRKNLLDQLQADLCLCVADNEREDPDNPFYRHARHVWRYPEQDDWGDAFDDAQRRSGCDAPWRRLLETGGQWLGGVKGEPRQPGSAGILLFFRWFLKERLRSTGTIDQYDRFVVTRSDFVHRIPHPPLRILDHRQIWIPLGEDYGGYTDRHIVANREDILRVLSIADPILAEPELLAAEMGPSDRWNLERFIKFSYARQGLTGRVGRYPYTMYTVRSIGGHTRWSVGRYEERLGYYIKYPSEYRRYRLARHLVRCGSDWTASRMAALRMLAEMQRYAQGLSRLVRRLTRPLQTALTQDTSG